MPGIIIIAGLGKLGGGKWENVGPCQQFEDSCHCDY